MRSPANPPPFDGLIAGQEPGGLRRIISSEIGTLPQNRYLHWSKLKHLKPPDGFSVQDWWLATKMARASAKHTLPLEDSQGQPFAFTDSGYLHRMLHVVDRQAAGNVALPDDIAGSDSRDFYLKSSLMEEAITSSQLEGAATTRLVAKEMLRSGRRPLDTGERMIVNNYLGMDFVRELADTDMSLGTLLELQRILTEGTLADPQSAGRLRRQDEDVAVVDERDGTVIHRPPDAARLEERLANVLAFANAKDEQQFLHPVVRAVLLHFMIGYEHPFVDGNGRTARALFYWAMTRAGYWLAEYLSISSIIRRAPAQYVRAYLFSETDDNDVTYFLDYNLRVLLRAMRELHKYLARKATEMRDTERLLENSALGSGLNHRQVAVVRSLRKQPAKSYTIDEHRRTNHVTYQTARTDLLKLAELGLLRMERTLKQGRAFHFTLAPDLRGRLGGSRDAPSANTNALTI